MEKPNFVKYPEMPHLAETLDLLDSTNLQVFEKIDGGNTQVRTHQGRILAGSRANFLTREEYFRFPWFGYFNKWAQSNASLRNIPENLIVYGEFTAPHSLNYFPDFTNKFFLIDIYDTTVRKFTSYDASIKKLEELGVEDVLFPKVLVRGEISLEKLKDLAMGESDYSAHGREGVVIKDYEKQRFAKLWRTSVDKTEAGLSEEIKKTIRSLSASGAINQENSTIKEKIDYLASTVLVELQRSGRIDKSLADITDVIKKISH